MKKIKLTKIECEILYSIFNASRIEIRAILEIANDAKDGFMNDFNDFELNQMISLQDKLYKELSPSEIEPLI